MISRCPRVGDPGGRGGVVRARADGRWRVPPPGWPRTGAFSSLPRGPLHRAVRVSARHGSWLPTVSVPKKGKSDREGSHSVFCNLISDVASSLLLYSVGHRDQPGTGWCDIKRWESLGANLEATYHCLDVPCQRLSTKQITDDDDDDDDDRNHLLRSCCVPSTVSSVLRASLQYSSHHSPGVT